MTRIESADGRWPTSRWGQPTPGARRSRSDIEADVRDLFGRLLAGEDPAEQRAPMTATEVADRTAWHESAHAYALWRFGLPIGEVAIDVRDGCGHTVREGDGPAWTSTTALLLLAAGGAGERMLFDDADGTCDDDETADRLLVLRGIPREQWAEARAVVDEGADRMVNQGVVAIWALASALIERHRLSGAEATAILHEFDDATVGAETRDALDDEYRDLVDEHRVVEFDPGVDHEEMLTRACARYGFDRQQAQDAFNRDCRRRHGLDGYRTQTREYGWTAA